MFKTAAASFSRETRMSSGSGSGASHTHKHTHTVTRQQSDVSLCPSAAREAFTSIDVEEPPPPPFPPLSLPGSSGGVGPVPNQTVSKPS